MNESLMFVLSLREMVSGGLAKIADTSRAVFGAVDKRIVNTQRQMSLAGQSVSQLNARLQELTIKRDLSIGTRDLAMANREMQVLQTRIDRMQTRGVNGGGGGGMRLPWWLSGAVIGGALAMGTMAMIKTGANQQRDITGLTTFMGAKGANSFYSNVQQEARLTPFVTHDLMAADRMLISTGMSAQRAQTDIHNLANAVAATGGSNFALERMAQHLQMIKSMGHASYLQLKEFTTNGINIMQLLSDATGKHIKMAHGMTVTYEAIERALAHAGEKGGLFFNALFAQSQTIWGKWSTLVDDLQVSAGKIVTGQSSAITGLLDLFDKYAQRLPVMAEQWGGAITNVTHHIIGLVGVVIDLAKWVYHNWTLVKGVIITFYAFKVAVWAATTVTALYNGVMTIAAIRATMLAAAEGEATIATFALGAAMEALPFVLIAAGIAAAVFGIAKLVDKSKDAGKAITDNLSPQAQHIKDITDIDKNNEKIAHQKAFRDLKRVSNNPFAAMAWLFTDARPKAIADTAATTKSFMPKLPIMMQSGANTTSQTTAQMVAAQAKGQAQDNSYASGEGDGIGAGTVTGGGSKKVIIQIRSFVEHLENHFKDAGAAGEWTEEAFTNYLLRSVRSVDGAL